MNTTSLIVLLFAPLIGFLINVFFGRKMSKNLSGVVGTASVLLSFVITLLLFYRDWETDRKSTVWTPVTGYDLVCRLLLEKKKKKKETK